jgi:hypothetical protein
VRQRDILAWGALAMAIIGTASAEYGLADAAGWGRVAFALPGCLDIYVVRALRAHRDMAAAVVAMILVNAVAHLISAGLLPVSVPVVVGVSAIAPLVLWRVHALREVEPETAAELAVPEFVTDPEPAGVLSEPLSVPAEPAPEPVTLERVPEQQVTGSTLPADLREAGEWVGAPVLGPLVPVAELLAGTSHDQAFPVNTEAPEPRGTERNLHPAPAEPSPVVPEPQSEPDQVPPGVSAEHVTLVRMWLKTEPKLTGTAIGTRLGTSDSYGRRVRRAALAVTA